MYKENMTAVHLCLILKLFIYLCYGQRIQMHKFNQVNCHTNCSHGLIKDIDYCLIFVTVQFNTSVPASTLLYFQELGEISQNLFSLDIPSECTGMKKDAKYYCTPINKSEFNITVKLIALPNFSNVEFQSFIAATHGRIESEILKFPEIYDLKDDSVSLNINGVNITNERQCNFEINETTLHLRIRCLSKVSPCSIVTQMNNSLLSTLSQNELDYKKTLEIGDELFINISYDVCSLKETFHSFICRIKQESRSLEKHSPISEDKSVNSVYIIVPTVFIILAIAFGILICILVKKRILPGPFRPEILHFQPQGLANSLPRNGSDNNQVQAVQFFDDEHSPNSGKKGITKDKSVQGSNKAEQECFPLLEKKDIQKDKRLKGSDKAQNLEDSKHVDEHVFQTEIIYPEDVDNSEVKIPPLILAIDNNQFEEAEMLIKNGCDVNEADKDNKTPLMYACEKKSIDLCTLLLKKGARVNERKKGSKSTALMIVSENGSKEIVEMLLERKEIDLELKNMSGHTALIIACKIGNSPIAEILINNCNIDVVDSRGYSPLMHACENGFDDVVSLLCNRGANVNITGDDGKTALALYESNGKPSETIVKLLRDSTFSKFGGNRKK